MRRVWKKRWVGFGKGGHAKRVTTNQQPSDAILRYAVEAAAGEHGKSVIMAGRMILTDQDRADGHWDMAAIKILAKQV